MPCANASNSHAVVDRLDLRVKNGIAPAQGTLEEPGKNVKQKRGLNRVLLDLVWGML